MSIKNAGNEIYLYDTSTKMKHEVTTTLTKENNDELGGITKH